MRRSRFPGALLVLAASLVSACQPVTEPVLPEAPFPDRIWLDRDAFAWTEATLKHLSLEQKVSQLFAVPAPGGFGSMDDPRYRRVLDLVRDMQVGGVIFFQGTPLDQASFVNELQLAAPVPLLISQDMETGAGMRLDGATVLPSAMSIAASRDPGLAYMAGRVTAAEARAVGVRQVLAPVADVNATAGNPVIDVRSFSDRPALTAVMVDAYVRGLQDGGVLATVKHFPGHGATSRDSHFSMPVLDVDYARLDSTDLVPFRAAIAAGVSSVMTAHVAYPGLDNGLRRPATLSPPLVEGLLRDSLGFDGLIVSDALNMAGVRGNATAGTIAVDAFQAGVDMLMMSTDVRVARRALLDALRTGRIDEQELDERVRRILLAKAAAGLHRTRFAPLDEVRNEVASAEHQAVAGRIARDGLTLLGDSAIAPISDRPGNRILLLALSDRADSERHTDFEALLKERVPDARLDVRLVVPGQAREMAEEISRLARAADDVVIAAFVSAATWRYRAQTTAGIRMLMNNVGAATDAHHLVVFGTPYLAGDAHNEALVYLAYGSGPAEQAAVADALTGRAGASGVVPVTAAEAHPFGAGIERTARYPRLAQAEEVLMESAALARIDSLIQAAIDERAFPGAAVAVGRPGAVVHSGAYGHHTYQATNPVSSRSSFDLASLTKVIATTTAVMQLYEQGRIDLDAPASLYLNDFGRNGKDSVTVRQLLTHTGGLTPFRPFYRMGIRSRGRVLQAIYNERLAYEPGTEYRYSDFGPIILAEIVSRLTGTGFATYTRRHIFEPLGMWQTGYRAVGRGARSDAVPTEDDGYFRFRLLQGEVHDENAWIMGGVAGHAGLFSSVDDLSRFANMILNEGRVGGTQFLQPETIRLFTAAVDTTLTHTRALGWDTKSPEGYSSAGQFFGPSSFGHTGFTGTSMWFDPDEKIYVILLSNRVYPTRNNRGHVAVRPALADLVHETIRDPDHVHLAD